MANLESTYLGLQLKSPLVVSSCPLSYHLDNLRRMEAAGAGAVVLYSLFEEQIELAEMGFSSYYTEHNEELPEALRHVASMKEYNQERAVISPIFIRQNRRFPFRSSAV